MYEKLLFGTRPCEQQHEIYSFLNAPSLYNKPFFSMSSFSVDREARKRQEKKYASRSRQQLTLDLFWRLWMFPHILNGAHYRLGRLTSHMSCWTADSSRPGCENIANTCLARFFDDDDFALTPGHSQMPRSVQEPICLPHHSSLLLLLLQSADTKPNPIVRNQVRSLRL